MQQFPVSVNQQVRVMQMIKFALIMGVLSFAAFVGTMSARPAQHNDSVTWIMVGIGVSTLLLRSFVPRLVVRSALQRIAAGSWELKHPFFPAPWVPDTDEGKLAKVYQTQMLVGSALIEGGVFANLYACMMNGHVANWVMFGLLLIALVFDFPTQSSVASWIESQRNRLNDERQLAGRV